MNIRDLPYPGNLAQGIALRQTALNAINGVQIVASKTPGGKTATASQLRAFFSACANALIPVDLTAGSEDA